MNRKIGAIRPSLLPLMKFFSESEWARRSEEPGICDFVLGNPHEALPEYVDVLRSAVEPRNGRWFAYKMNERCSRAAIVESLRDRRNVLYDEEDVFVTNGAIGALSVLLQGIVDSGEEVLFMSPPWFLYEPMIVNAGAVPVRVRVEPGTFDLDLKAIASALSEETRAVIVNSPHNPTGRVYGPGTFAELGRILKEASERFGRLIYLISDESYSRIVFDGRTYHSPTSFYPASFLVYTYGKVLLTPGQRIGYIAITPGMPGKEELREALFLMQMASGWAFPNAVLQYSLAELEKLSIDVKALESRRDRMVEGLRRAGYEPSVPEGTFYVLVRSPMDDDVAFVELLATHDIFCIPGAMMDLPGYFRISLTATDAMVERSLPGFRSAMEEATASRLSGPVNTARQVHFG